MKKKIIITGGHFTPAIALIEEIKKSQESWEIFYFGAKRVLADSKQNSYEFETINKIKNIGFINFKAGKIQRKLKSKFLINLIKIPFGFINGFYQVLRINPDIVVSFGGNLSVPIVFSAWLMAIPSITHEQTSTIGLANKINSLFVKKFAVSFPNLVTKIIKNKGVFVGNPVRPQIFKKSLPKKSEIYKKIQKNKKPVIYITGGKTGSRIINQSIKKIINELTKTFFVIHQFGLDEKTQLFETKNYLPLRFVSADEIGGVLNKAKIVISRAGANIVFELLALKKPAILIPIPWASENEQKKNALFLKRQGLAEIISQKELSPLKLMKTVRKVDDNFHEYELKNKSNANPKTAGKNLWNLTKQTVKNNES